MSGPDSAKTLLIKHNRERLAQFKSNDSPSMLLPAISENPLIITAGRCDHYEKNIPYSSINKHYVSFLTKNNEPHGFLWRTTQAQLREGIRWGMIKPESITGRVIATLGHYRILAHEFVAKGMIGNTHTVKLRLLDVYQDRFEALQALESLVNRDNTVEQYKKVIGNYISELTKLQDNLSVRFIDTLSIINQDDIIQLKKDLQGDIDRAKIYLHDVEESSTLLAMNRSRGHCSILEFVKQQMLTNLYELQGINQDITYSNKRPFALTRGRLNDLIEDARKEIDDDDADPRNAVTDKHHGIYGKPDDYITYDFSNHALSSEQERQTLLAISFIEGWDKVVIDDNQQQIYVQNTDKNTSEPLTIVHASQWQRHRSIKSYLIYSAHFLLTSIKSIFVETRPWEEECWTPNKNFHLVATSLRQHAKPNEPLWRKPIKFFRMVGYMLIDIFKGIRDFGFHLIIELPNNLINDWSSSLPLDSMETILNNTDAEILTLKNNEKDSLDKILGQLNQSPGNSTETTGKLATVDYHLTAGEQNDILNATLRGISAFSSVFTHTIYGKDPIAGLLFTAAYVAGGLVIFLPAYSAGLFGVNYVNWFTHFSYTMASTKSAAAIAGGSTQAQLIASGWDMMLRGPSSFTVQTLTHIAEDPLTMAVYSGAAFGLGYVLVNGVAGYAIPGISEIFKADLGSSPATGYPVIGAKIFISIHEALEVPVNDVFYPSLFVCDTNALTNQKLSKENINRIYLAAWLSRNADSLPKLNHNTLSTLSRLIRHYFTKEQALSLNKLLYPEKVSSIAVQFFSIPLTYIPLTIRFLIAIPLSLIAALKGNPYPGQPIYQTTTALINKIKKDSSRLIIAGASFIYLIASLAASLIKMIVFPLNMFINRLTGFINKPSGHAWHKIFAAVHVFFRQIGAWCYPERATKSVVFAHPTHTISEIEASYFKLIHLMPPNQTKDVIDFETIPSTHTSSSTITTSTPCESESLLFKQ